MGKNSIYDLTFEELITQYKIVNEIEEYLESLGKDNYFMLDGYMVVSDLYKILNKYERKGEINNEDTK